MGTSNRAKELSDKLMKDRLSPDERKEINEHAFVADALKGQWDSPTNIDLDESREDRILGRIMQRIHKNGIPSFYKFGWAAAIALFLICGSLGIMLINKTHQTNVLYVLNSGNEAMDSVRLSDGTFVLLSARSKLTYPKEFDGDKREVTLSGQAFFKVKHDADHPFVVNTKKMIVTDLGTEFEVYSYDKDNTSETTLLNGKVSVKPVNNNTNDDSEQYILKPNEKLIADDNGSIRIEKVNADNYTSWRSSGKPSFKDAKLSVILPRLEKWYGEHIYCPADIAEQYRFTFTIHNESLDFILNMISSSAPLDYQLSKNNLYIITRNH